MRAVVDCARAPTVAELSRDLALPKSAVRRRLRDLQSEHGVVLHPKSDEVWMLHPFALAPTHFSIHGLDSAPDFHPADELQNTWFTTCAWCSLGAATLLDRDCVIRTRLGAHGEMVEVRCIDGQLQGEDFLVHFPIPMSEAWDNVAFTCSTMLLFRHRADVEAWCHHHGLPLGDLRRLSQFWPFAQAWYGRHLDPHWRKWTLDEARQLFRRFGLDGPIWQLPEDSPDAATQRF